MLVSWIGDQSLVVGHVLKFGLISVRLIAYEYRQVTYLRPKRMAMRVNYPPVRLNIEGVARTYH